MRNEHPVNRISRSSLFLIELIIAIFFLALTSVVCVRLYLSAHQLSQQSADLTHSVQEAQKISECFIPTEGQLSEALSQFLSLEGAEALTNAVPETMPGHASVRLLYDSDWQLVSLQILTSGTVTDDAAASAGGEAASSATEQGNPASVPGASYEMLLQQSESSGRSGRMETLTISLLSAQTQEIIYETKVEQYTQ